MINLSGKIQQLLDEKVLEFNVPGFIENDPICIPHSFSKKEDIEIMGLWTAVLAWGQRVTIINKCRDLIERMDHAPHDFILGHQESDLKRLVDFKHRTFNDTDSLYFIHYFKTYYQQHNSLEEAFMPTGINTPTMKERLVHFHEQFFALEDAPQRTRKHIATPARKSTCKRLNMFLRWMVRDDGQGVDFGIWKNITPSELYCPLDVHVDRVARKLGLIERKQTDWQTVEELMASLRTLDPNDPAKYDFALFGMGVDQQL